MGIGPTQSASGAAFTTTSLAQVTHCTIASASSPVGRQLGQNPRRGGAASSTTGVVQARPWRQPRRPHAALIVGQEFRTTRQRGAQIKGLGAASWSTSGVPTLVACRASTAEMATFLGGLTSSGSGVARTKDWGAALQCCRQRHRSRTIAMPASRTALLGGQLQRRHGAFGRVASLVC